MSNERLKRRTIRLSPFVDNELNEIAKKNNITVNKLVSELIKYHIEELDKVNNISNVATILNSLENMNKQINEIQKKCNWLDTLTKQIFLNSGFARNRNTSDDPIYNEFVNKYYKGKYDKDFNA